MAVVPGKTVVAITDPIHCTWARRNRLTETTPLSWTDSDQTPEAGQTTTIILYKVDGATEITRISGLTGTSYDLAWSAFGGEQTAILKFISERDGYESLTGYAIQVTLPVLTISGTPVTTATKGVAYAGFTVTGSGGTAPYTYSLVGTWPAGLSVNASTGAVSGTPTVNGSFTGLSVRVTDANSATADLAAFALEVGAAAAAPLDGLAPTAAWSMSRDLRTAFAGNSRYTEVSGTVSSLTDQSGNALHQVQANALDRPTITTSGPSNRTCVDFDGTDRFGGAASSSFIAASTGYMVVSFLPDAITLNTAAASNHQIIGCANGNFGLFLQNTTGSPETIYALNNDGTVDQALSVEIVAGTAYVAEWRHEGGNVYLRVNGGTEFSVPSGNTSTLFLSFNIGGNLGKFNGKIFEAATFSTVPSPSARDALVANFMAHIGI